MGMLSPKNNKGEKKGNKSNLNNVSGSKFISKPGKAAATGFTKKKLNTGGTRGS